MERQSNRSNRSKTQSNPSWKNEIEEYRDRWASSRKLGNEKLGNTIRKAEISTLCSKWLLFPFETRSNSIKLDQTRSRVTWRPNLVSSGQCPEKKNSVKLGKTGSISSKPPWKPGNEKKNSVTRKADGGRFQFRAFFFWSKKTTKKNAKKMLKKNQLDENLFRLESVAQGKREGSEKQKKTATTTIIITKKIIIITRKWRNKRNGPLSRARKGVDARQNRFGDLHRIRSYSLNSSTSFGGIWFIPPPPNIPLLLLLLLLLLLSLIAALFFCWPVFLLFFSSGSRQVIYDYYFFLPLLRSQHRSMKLTRPRPFLLIHPTAVSKARNVGAPRDRCEMTKKK